MTNNILQCALGVHRYDKETKHVFLCSICKRARHYRSSDGFEWWNEYDEKGRVTHYKDSQGVESRYEYDENGREVRYRNTDGIV